MSTDAKTSEPSEILRKREEFVFPSSTTYYEEPLALVRGEGAYVWDDSGNRYLDGYGGAMAISIGHANPVVTEAVVRQIRTLQHTSALYANQPQSDLAEKLHQITPGRLKRSFFTNSGTEADDTAIAVAQVYTGRQPLLVLRHGYSGYSAKALTATGIPNWRQMPVARPNVIHASAPYCYRCPYKLSYPECGLACADELEDIIRTTVGEIAAFMAEPVIGFGGFIVPPAGYFERAVEIARRHGGLFIADEVQTAWGRTGDKWFGIEHWNVEPDIITSAEGMANGAPIGMTTATEEVAAPYPGLTLSTFGGNPVSATAALAVIQYIEEEDLRHNAAVVGEYLRARLEGLKEKHRVVGDVRGLGLMQALELVKDRETKEPHPQAVLKVLGEAKRRGVLLGAGGFYSNVILTGLPLTAESGQVDELVEALDAALALHDSN
jgi:4-aminobutyrate aminotransferase-like enzyme